MNKLVPCAWLLSGVLEVWSLRLRNANTITTVVAIAIVDRIYYNLAQYESIQIYTDLLDVAFVGSEKFLKIYITLYFLKSSTPHSSPVPSIALQTTLVKVT